MPVILITCLQSNFCYNTRGYLIMLPSNLS
nr:MAG TPA: hypothetical protein [Caudoviricetes sp.]